MTLTLFLETFSECAETHYKYLDAVLSEVKWMKLSLRVWFLAEEGLPDHENHVILDIWVLSYTSQREQTTKALVT